MHSVRTPFFLKMSDSDLTGQDDYFTQLYFVRVRLIASVPGRHTGLNKTKWGHLKLRKVMFIGSPHLPCTAQDYNPLHTCTIFSLVTMSISYIIKTIHYTGRPFTGQAIITCTGLPFIPQVYHSLHKFTTYGIGLQI